MLSLVIEIGLATEKGMRGQVHEKGFDPASRVESSNSLLGMARPPSSAQISQMGRVQSSAQMSRRALAHTVTTPLAGCYNKFTILVVHFGCSAAAPLVTTVI